MPRREVILTVAGPASVIRHAVRAKMCWRGYSQKGLSLKKLYQIGCHDTSMSTN